MTKSDDRIDRFRGQYFFLSNFYICRPGLIHLPGEDYPHSFRTTEHAYQAAKSRRRTDWDAIRELHEPREAKAFGQTLPLRDGWDNLKRTIMYSLLNQKFSDPNLRKALLSTGDSVIVEGNTWGDRYWGVVDGVGENYLGQLLMTLRNSIRHPPTNFLEGHALQALKAEPTWTVTMYSVYNDLDDQTTKELREFLRQHLPESQWR